jgi:hypothetical protein
MAMILTQPRTALRMSWGAVFAGVVLSLVAGLILNMLGAGIGASALAPLKYQNPLQGFGFATGAWLLIASVISVVIGSYLAGRCAPVLGWLHGMLAWSVTMLVVVYLSLSFAASALSAADNVAGQALNAAAVSNRDGGNAGQSGAQALANTAQQQVQQNGIDPNAPVTPQMDAQARVTADNAAHNVARATWWGFALLVLGAVISAAAGNLGFRHQPLDETSGGAALAPSARVVPTAQMREEISPLR